MNLEEQIYYSCAAYSSIHPNRAAVLNHLFCVIGNGYEWENGELVECCGDTTTKSGRRLSVKAAINQVFRRRRKNDEYRKDWERKRKREDKLALKHKKDCPITPCDCGASARIAEKEKLDKSIDEMIDRAIEQMKNAPKLAPKEAAAERQRLAEESKRIKKEIRESRKYEYRAPADIEQRVKDTAYDYWYPMCEYSRMVTFPDDIKDEWLDAVIETARLVIASPRKIDSNNPAERIAETTAIANKCLARALALKAART